MLLTNKKKINTHTANKRIQSNKRLNCFWHSNVNLVALEPKQMTVNQFMLFVKQLKAKIKTKTTVRPHLRFEHSITQKPIETKLGKGKGNVVTTATQTKFGSTVAECHLSSDLLGSHTLNKLSTVKCQQLNKQKR